MNTIYGNSIWLEQNRLENKYAALFEDEVCDVLIIGGGITGALCSYYFAKAGINTVLIEKNVIASGSTGVSSSIMQYEADCDITGLKNRIGMKNALKAFRLCTSALDNISTIISDLQDLCGFERKDSFYYSSCSRNTNKMKEEYLLRRYTGFDVEYIDSKTAFDMFSFPVEGGIYSNNLAAEIDPVRFAKALVEYSRGKGLRVYEKTKMTELSDVNEGEFIAYTEDGYKIKAKKVIIAVGYDAKGRYGGLYSTQNVFEIATKPVSGFNGWYNRCIIKDDSSPYNYFRTTSDDRIIAGGRNSNVIDGKGKVAGLLKVPYFPEQKYLSLQKQTEDMFAGIEDICVEYKFGGIYGETKDGLPYIGEHYDQRGVYYALCYGSNGLLFADIAGRLLVDYYQGNAVPDLELFRMGR